MLRQQLVEEGGDAVEGLLEGTPQRVDRVGRLTGGREDGVDDEGDDDGQDDLAGVRHGGAPRCSDNWGYYYYSTFE